MEIEGGIEEAINEAVRAGVFRKAARLNTTHTGTWERLAAPHSARADQILAGICDRLGV